MASGVALQSALRQLVVVGRRNLSNRVLLETLAMEMASVDCLLLGDDEFLSFLMSDLKTRQHAGLMVLFDSEGEHANRLVPLLEHAFAYADQPILVLCQCIHDGIGESMIGWPGVKGVFYTDTRPQEIVLGVQAMAAGEYQIPQALLVRHLEHTRVRPERREELDIGLTAREAEILVQLSKGHGNQYIADQLELSCHTIKTHVYNLFRKVGVSNRVQLVNWAREHRFDDCEPGLLRLLVTTPVTTPVTMPVTFKDPLNNAARL